MRAPAAVNVQACGRVLCAGALAYVARMRDGTVFMTAKRPQLKAGDKALIAVLAAVLVAGAVWVAWRALSGGTGAHLSAETQANSYVVVAQTAHGFYRADPLSADVEYTVETPGTGSGADAEGGENLVRIHGGAVEVVSANCANQVCVEHDFIQEPDEQIVCLPHGLVIEVVEHEEDATALS